MADVLISAPQKVTRPAVPAKEFAALYILFLVINAREGGAQDSIYIEWCPYDAASGEKLLTHAREIRLPLWPTVKQIPGLEVLHSGKAALAFPAIAEALPELIALQAVADAAAVS